MKRSTPSTPSTPSTGHSIPPAAAAKLKKRPSSLAELRDRQRSTKVAKTASSSSSTSTEKQHHQQQPSIASFFSPAAAASASASTSHKQNRNNPFRHRHAAAATLSAVKPPAPSIPTAASVPLPAPEQRAQPGPTDLLDCATRPYHPRRTCRDPLSLLRSISTDTSAFAQDSDSDSGEDLDHDTLAPPPPAPQLDVAALVKSVASLHVCVQGTQLALGARESAYRSQAHDDDDFDEDEGDGDQEEDGDAWGDAAMSSGDDEFDDDGIGEGDNDGRTAWFDALLDDDHSPIARADPSDMYHDPLLPPAVEPKPKSKSTLNLLLDSSSPRATAFSTHALALPRRLTFTATHPSTASSLLSTFSPAVHPISDPSLLSTSFSAFLSSSPSLPTDPATTLVANLHHFRFPPTQLAPAARSLLARTLASSTTWPPQPMSADVAWYLAQVDMWQAALRHLASEAPPDGFMVVQQLAPPTATTSGAGAAAATAGGFVVAVQGYLEGAYVLNASRGMRRAMVAACVEGIQAVAGPGLVALREDEDDLARGIKSGGAGGRRKLARQYVVDYDGEDGQAGDEHLDDVPDDNNQSNPSPPPAAAAAAPSDDPILDPTQTSLLYVPPDSTPALLSFLHTFPTSYNLQSAHAPDPELPVLLASTAFAHASVACASVTKCGHVSSAVHGERAVRVQVDGWVLPWKVEEVVRAVAGGEAVEARVEVGVSWEDGCGVVREAAGGRSGGTR